MYWIDDECSLNAHKLGPVLLEGVVPQVTVPHDCWFAAVIEGTDLDANQPLLW